VLRAVRKSAPDIAFFVLTNHPHEGYRTSAMRLGARGFYDKSSEFDKLREALARTAGLGIVLAARAALAELSFSPRR